MDIRTFASCVVDMVRTQILPTLPSGTPQGVASALAAAVALRPAIVENAVLSCAPLVATGAYSPQTHEVDVELASALMLGYFDGAQRLDVPLGFGRMYSLTKADAERFASILRQRAAQGN